MSTERRSRWIPAGRLWAAVWSGLLATGMAVAAVACGTGGGGRAAGLGSSSSPAPSPVVSVTPLESALTAALAQWPDLTEAETRERVTAETQVKGNERQVLCLTERGAVAGIVEVDLADPVPLEADELNRLCEDKGW